jgi:Zn-dependent metalloprotease
MKLNILSVLSILIIKFCIGQNNNYFNPPSIYEINKKDFGNGWHEFKDSLVFCDQTFFQQNKSVLGLGNNDEMILKRISSDNNGWIYYHFQQYYKGLAVKGGQYILHKNQDKVVFGNGKIIYDLNINISPTLSQQNAFLLITDSILNSDKSYIQADSFKSSLIIFPKNHELLINENYTLAYELILFSNIGDVYSYVDALNGNILSIIINESFYQCENNTINTEYYGQRNNLKVKHSTFLFWHKYSLVENCNNILTLKKNYTNDIWEIIEQSDDQWEGPHATAHWAAQIAYNSFLNVFDRWSFDHAGSRILITPGFVCAGGMVPPPLMAIIGNNLLENSCSDYYGLKNHILPTDLVIMIYGPYAPWPGNQYYFWPTALDAIGHEFTHGVLWHTANLVINDPTLESSALAEGICDIFGKMIEWWAAPDYFNWTMGYHWAVSGNYLRNLSDFIFYGSSSWNNGDHYVRSKVISHWFYVLSEGKDFNHLNISVEGISKEKAIRIVYYMIDNLLTSYSNYQDARNASIIAAIRLFGDCSHEMIQVIKAWQAVNVTSPYGWNYTQNVDCNILNRIHEGYTHTLTTFPYITITLPAAPYYTRTFDNLHANCNITPNGKSVTFVAGNEIRLLPGFSSGDNFRAYIEPCIDLTNKIMMNDNDNHLQYIGYSDILETNKFEKQESFYEDNFFTIHPNPFSNSFTISFTQPEQTDAKIYLTDAYGRQVLGIFSGSVDKGQHSIDVTTDGITKGLYFCIMETPSGRNVLKVVKNE